MAFILLSKIKHKAPQVAEDFTLMPSGKLYIPSLCLGRQYWKYKSVKIYADCKEKKVKIVVLRKYDSEDMTQRKLIKNNKGGFIINMHGALRHLDIPVMGNKTHIKFEKKGNSFAFDLADIKEEKA